MKKDKIDIKTRKEEKEKLPTIWDPWDIEPFERWLWEEPFIFPRWWRRRWGLPALRELWERFEKPGIKYANVDLVDTGKEYKVIAEMPGVDKEDIEICVTQNGLEISGKTRKEIREEDKGYIRRERSYSTICRTVMFPEEVNPEKAEATLKDGILEINIEKKTPTKSRKVEIK